MNRLSNGVHALEGCQKSRRIAFDVTIALCLVGLLLESTASLAQATKVPDSVARAAVPEAVGGRIDGRTAAERAAALVRYAANLKPKDELYPKAAASAYAARLLLNVDTNYALTKLDAAVSSRLAMARRKLVSNPLNPPGLDPFDKVVLIHTYGAKHVRTAGCWKRPS